MTRNPHGFKAAAGGLNHAKLLALAKLAAVCGIAILTTTASATIYTWDGNFGGGNSKWSNPANWGPPDLFNMAPPTGPAGLLSADIRFAGFFKTSVQMDQNYFIRSLTFDPTAGAFTISPQQNPPNSETLTLGAGGITQLSPLTQTINVPLVLSNSQIWLILVGDLVVNGSLDLQINNLSISGGRSVSLTGPISGNGGISISGGGVLNIFSGNTYSGDTLVNSATLTVNNTAGSATGTGNVILGSGSRLYGNGIIGGNVTLNGGSLISAGDSPGLMGIGSMVWNGGAGSIFEINSALAGEGLGWDILDIADGLQINATSANRFTIDIQSLTLGNSPGAVSDFDPSQFYSWRFATTDSGISFLPGESASTAFNVNLSGFGNGFTGSFTVERSLNGFDLNLLYNPVQVPEPSAGAVMLAGFLIMLVQFARQNRQTTSR